MTELKSHRQKKYLHQIFFYLFLLILVIIFIVTIGIKLLINITLFIAEFSHRQQDKSIQETKRGEFLLPPEILNLPSATNSGTIQIAGRADQGKNLSIYLNNKLSKELALSEETFETELNLETGENSIYLVLEDPKTKEKKQSITYKIIYKNEKPKLEISAPKDQEKISSEETRIIGQTDKEVFIKINDLPVVVDAEGKFSQNLKLKEGENKIKIEAQDMAGNIETKELTVIYQKEE
jgi:hypothetical protein